MPNILLTQTCVRSCPYCFARRHMSESSPEDIISWENIIYLADFLQAAGELRFPILGGEPTLHPEFNNILLYLLERNFAINVFTSGIMSEAKLEEAVSLFRDVPPDRLSFVCNLNDPEKTPTALAETECVRRFLRNFGDRTIPGFNVYRTDFDLQFIFQQINEFGLHRTIRLGIAHPIPGGRNLHIAVDQMDQVIERLFSFAPLFERLRIKPGFDCGFPKCRFSDEQLGWLYRMTGDKYDFGCNPVIDIGPDMQVWPCFPLSSFHKRSIFEFNSLKDAHEYYRKLHENVRTEVAGIFEECDSCRFREDRTCAGGCLAHGLSRFQNEAPIRMKDIYS